MLARSLILFALAAAFILAASGDAVATSCADDYSETASLEIESVTVDGKSVAPSPGHRIGTARVHPRRDKTLAFEVSSSSDRYWDEAYAP